MKKCPNCGEHTLKTREEELKKVQPKEIGDCFNRAYIAVRDAWSLCSELCISCGYVK